MSGIANVGSMDCSGELPSGKSVYDKLDLDDEAPDEEHPLGAPVMFVKAPVRSKLFSAHIFRALSVDLLSRSAARRNEEKTNRN